MDHVKWEQCFWRRGEDGSEWNECKRSESVREQRIALYKGNRQHHHHTTIAQHSTSHYYMPHVPRQISQTLNVATSRLGPPYSIYITPQSAHTTTSRSTTNYTIHIAPFHIHNYSAPHPHSASQHISHHTIFHIHI